MNLRQEMPSVAWLVDVARALCGAAPINEQIRAGMAGAADRFHAVENGREVGTPMTLRGGVTVAEMAPIEVPVDPDEQPKPKGVRRGR